MKLEALRAEVQKGAESGASLPAETVFAEVRARLVEGNASRSDRQ